MKIVFTADVHGNLYQYNLLFKYAEINKADAVIIGGDITPKNISNPLQAQKVFFESQLVPLAWKYCPKFKIMLMLGNDDFASGLESLKKFDGEIFELINMKKVSVGNIDVVGYSYVPVTPFAMKDFEKWDSKEQPLDGLRLCGVMTKDGNIVEVCLDTGNRVDTIDADMKKLAEISDPKNTVYVFHAPPFGTKLDMISSNVHVGSKSIRKFIEKNKPLLTLHGHIHETVDVSGSYLDIVGKTTCAAVGNYHDLRSVAVVVVDTDHLDKINRIILK